MQRSSSFRKAGLTCLTLLALALPARAGTIAAEDLPLPNRVANADLVVIGKVTAIEDKPEQVATTPGGKNKIEYKIAVVQISDTLVAPKQLTTVRIGFIPPPPMVMISPPPFVPTVGLEGCFFLSRQSGADFYLAHGQLQFMGANSPNYKENIAMVKRAAKILEEPNMALKSTDVGDRLMAASMLMSRHLKRKSPNDKTEPIDAAQSKLILSALASADWTPTTDLMTLSPLMVFRRLPLTAADGYDLKNPTPQAYAEFAKKWLTEHADTYRIQRFVADKTK